jgi:uncharacterized FAD-dependent dehydrogenase
MSIEKSMERFRKVKEKIRTAIINKGVEVPINASLADMAAAIDEIKVSKTNRKKEKEDV